MLAGLHPVYLQPEWNETWGIPLGITLEKVEKALQAFPDARAFLLLHPTYEGLVSDAAKIIDTVHQSGKYVIADEAHGGHFSFHPKLPPSALESGADICVQGTHKVLGALTQAGMLHVRAGFPSSKLREALSYLESSSPSFLMLASLDLARRQAALEGQALLEKALHAADFLHTKIKSFKGLRLLDAKALGFKSVIGEDPLRLAVSASSYGMSGNQMAKLLRKKFRIQPEFSNFHYVLFLMSFADRQQDSEQLAVALEQIGSHVFKHQKPSLGRISPPPLPEVVLSPRDAYFGPKRGIALEEAEGEIAGEMIVPYPPGIPILCPGEKITGEVLDYLHDLLPRTEHLQGAADQNLQQITVLDD